MRLLLYRQMRLLSLFQKIGATAKHMFEQTLLWVELLEGGDECKSCVESHEFTDTHSAAPNSISIYQLTRHRQENNLPFDGTLDTHA